MRRGVVVLLVLLSFTAALPASAGTADRSSVRFTDPAGDVRDGRGDIRWVSAQYTERAVIFKAGLKKYQHWKSLNWRHGITTMLWELDVDGDRYSDYSAEVANSGENRWVARLIDLDWNEIVCRGTAAQDGRTLTLRLPFPRCFGSVTAFRVGGTMLYDNKPFDKDNRLQVDLAPRGFSRWVRRPKLTTSLTWKARGNRVRVPYGEDTSFVGKLRDRLGGVSGASVILDSRNSANEAWRREHSSSTAYYADGEVYWYRQEPATRSMQFRMRYGGSPQLKASRSPVLHLDVTMAVTAEIDRSGVALGQPVTVSGTVAPAQPGTAVQLQQLTSKGWQTVQTTTMLFGGSYSMSVTPPTTGDLVYRVRHGGDTLRVAGYSPSMRVRVYTGRVVGVQPSSPTEELANLNSEYITVKNTGRVPLSLSGWLVEANLVDASDIPAVRTDLAPGASTRVHSGVGTNRTGHVYLNRQVPMWAPAGLARLYDEHGDLVHEHRYTP